MAERDELLFGNVRVWTDDGPEDGEETEIWGEPTDVAAAVLSAFDTDSPVTGLVLSLTRGVPEGQPLNPRRSDPRSD